MLQELIIAGFGGQGVMSMGQLLAYAAMLEGKGVSWLPSYGPEQRGGTANVTVIISDQMVGSPVVTYPTSAIVLNRPSFEKFEPMVQPNGLLIVNSSLIDLKSNRTDITILEIPASELANELNEPKVANTIILGAFIEKTKVIDPKFIIESLKKVLPERRHNLIPVNELALKKGAEIAR